MNSKIILTKRFSAIFLAIVLVTGTITALSFPSSIMGTAQAQPYYYDDGIDNGYNNYEPIPKYPSYGNNNYESKDSSNSLNLKKINCNNINSNLNGIESTTDLNGLLGVGGVESIQGDEDASANAYAYDGRTNDKFDLDCINNNDNEGVGPAGPQGPAGPNQIDSTNLYRADGEEVFINNETRDFFSSIAVCDSGDVVYEGGYNIIAGEDVIPPFTVGPLPNPEGFPPYAGPNNSAYEVTFFTNALFFQAYAYCFDNPPAHVP